MPLVKKEAVWSLRRKGGRVVNQDMAGGFWDPALRFARQTVYLIGQGEPRVRPRVPVVPVTRAGLCEDAFGGLIVGPRIMPAVGRAFEEFAAFCVAPKRPV